MISLSLYSSPVPVANLGTSWADRVKGKKPIRPIATSPVKEEPAKQPQAPAPAPAPQVEDVPETGLHADRVSSMDGTHSEGRHYF